MTDAVQVEPKLDENTAPKGPKLVPLRVNLSQKSSDDLADIMKITGLNATDSVNAAIQALRFFSKESKKGRTIHIRSRYKRSYRRVEMDDIFN